MATSFNLLWINGLLNQTDSSKRFFPMANSCGLRNFKTERADPLMQEFTAGGKIFIRDAIRNNQFLVTGPAASTRNDGIINGFRCKPYGVYIIDRGQNLIGVLSSATGNCDVCDCNSQYKNTGLACSDLMRDPYNLIWVPLYANDGTRNGILLDSGAYLYPIPVDQESVYSKLEFNNAKDNAQQLMVNFDFVTDFKDSTLNQIPCSSFTDWTPSMIRGLVDVCPVFTDVDQTFLVVQATTLDGNAVNKTLAQGWVIGDFTLKNTTTNSSITILTCVENPSKPGEYKLTYTSQSSGNTMLLTATKTGFDTTCFAVTPFAIGQS